MTKNYLSPVSGKETVVKDGADYLCLETGYHFDETADPETLRPYMSPYVWDSKIVDSEGKTWFKLVAFTDKHAMLPVETGWVVHDYTNVDHAVEITNEISYQKFIDAFNELYRRKNQE